MPLFPLRHLQGQRTAAQQVEMQMGRRLPGVGAAVAHHPEATLQLLAQLGNHFHTVGTTALLEAVMQAALSMCSLGITKM